MTTDSQLISFTPKRALLSVSDKRGIVALAKALYEKEI
jgi:phosphoribosylaminoimidazolecarboxamide formyltransferase/IMP cyclohydrolase